MRLRLVAVCLAIGLAPAAGATSGLTATFAAPTHTPKVNVKWFYTVRATRAGKPVRATVTTQIVDPVGGVHAVEFGDTHRFVTNLPFTGVFRDFIRFPAEAQGIRVTVRVIVKAAGARRVLSFWVKTR